MKTSKKLLSLLLAAVMVITSCSVGFTAFAADGNKTDANLTYWNDGTDAESAFNTLNGLFNELLSIDAVKKLLDDNNIGYKDKDGNPSISAIVENLSPTIVDLLMNKLGGLGIDLSTFIGKTSYSRTDFLQDKLGKGADNTYLYDPDDASKADAVRKYNEQFKKLHGDGDDFINYYTLYYLTRDVYLITAKTTTDEYQKYCGGDENAQYRSDNKNKYDNCDKDFIEYCQKTYPKLEALYESCLPSEEEQSKEFIDELRSDITRKNAFFTPSYTSYSENFNYPSSIHINDYIYSQYKGKAVNSYGTDFIEANCKYHYDYYNNILTSLGYPAITNLGELLYYYEAFPAKMTLQYDLALKYVTGQGVNLTADMLGGDPSTSITADNTESLALASMNAATFFNKYKASTTNAYPFYMPSNGNTGNSKNRVAKLREAYYKIIAYDKVFIDPNVVSNNAFRTGYEAYTFPSMNRKETTLKGYQHIPVWMSIASPYYQQMTMGLLKESTYGDAAKFTTDAQIEDLFVTDGQIQALIDYATENNWGADSSKLEAFLDSSSNKFSKYATEYIKALIKGKYSKDSMDAFTGALKGSTVAAVKALTIDDYSAALDPSVDEAISQGYIEGIAAMGFADRVNNMVPSQVLYDTIPEDLISEIATIGSAGSYAEIISGISVYDYYTYLVANTPATSEGDSQVYNYDDYKIDDDMMLYVANITLNTVIDGALADGMVVGDLIKSLVQTDINLGDALKDLWLNLYKQPAATIVNLLPTLLIVVDEIALPAIFHDENDVAAPNLSALLLEQPGKMLNKYARASGDDTVGIGKFYFDLNIVLPSVLHWLNGDKAGAKAIAGTYADVADAPKLDSDGNPVLDGSGNPVVTHYDDNIVRFTDIYVVDKIITASSDSKSLIANIVGEEKAGSISKGLTEIIDELISFAGNSVDNYLAAHRDDKRFGKKSLLSSETGKLQSGLNYLSVSLPFLIDQLGKDFIAKYSVDSDWAFAYDGKIVDDTFTSGSFTGTQKINAHYQAFKELANAKSPSRVLYQLVDLLIGNWINALLDFLNDTLMDDSNDITSKVPLVQGLVAAIGGFGEQSIITDVFNGLFQLKRSDDASFSLKKRDKTGFVGFSNEVGFYLINNIQYVKEGETRGLIPFITTIVKPDEKKKADYKVKRATGSTAPLLANSKKANKSAAGTDYSKLLTKDNVKAAQKLVDVLDELLSSLLANTSLNGFDFDSTDNILSGVVTLFAAYFGGKNTNDLIKLLNNYLYYVSGESNAQPSKKGKIGTRPTSDGDVDKNKVYTSANLSNLVIQTYSFVENLVDYLFYNKDNGFLSTRDPNMLIADAAYGIISPDAVSVRMDSKKYSKTIDILQSKDYHNWNSFKVQITGLNKDGKIYNTQDFLKYGFSKGDKEAFYEALGESLNGIAGILGAALTTSYVDSKRSGNLYSEVLYPVLDYISEAVGASGVMTPAAFNKATAAQQLTKGIITPVGNILAQIYDKPASFILNTVKGLAGILQDSTISKVLGGITGTVDLHVNGVCAIVAYLSPTYSKDLKSTINKALEGFMGTLKKLPSKNIAVSLVNKLLGDSLGIKLPNINWKKLNTAKSPAEVLLLIYGYVVDTILNIDFIKDLIDSLDPSISKILKKLNAAQILTILTQIIAVVQSPTEVYWTFSEYAHKLTNTFKYPKGMTASQANKAVDQLDQIVENVFPLLNGLGVTDIEGLDALVNDNLYTNEIITTIAKALYGALTSNSTVTTILGAIDIDVTPQGLAKYLMDRSYGKTYSSAASTLKKAKSWDKVKTINWGFKNGSKNAQKGFINGLAASLRPLNDVLSILLCEGKLDLLKKLDVKGLINGIATKGTTEIFSDKGEYAATINYAIKNGKLTVTIQSYATTSSDHRTTKSVFEIDINAIADDIQKILNDIEINLGTNGYESAVIPILEAFMCDDVKTYKQYKADYKKAKDNLLIDILNPIGKLINTIIDAPFDTLTAILPNVAYFLDSNGLAQAIGNLLAPITSDKGILGVLKKNGLDIDKLIKAITGKNLGKVITDLIGTDVKFNLELGNLKACNIQDLVLPIIRMLTKDLGITIPDFTWKQLASHGTVKTVKSAARNDKGKFLTEQVQARQGEVLVAVFRYIADALIKNAKVLKKLICGIDAIKKNATLKSIIGSVFDQIGTASKDDIVNAIFYVLAGHAQDRFFDYTNFKYDDSYKFSWGDLDEDFCRQLAPMLDGLIGGLLEGGLNGLVSEKLYTDELIGKLATGLYGAIEGVKISDDLGSLTDLLAMTDIDFSTKNVAKLLTDKDYGQPYGSAASVIRSAGSWKNVKAENLKFGVKDRDSFMHALVAVLRPIYGVLDVLLNDASLNLFNLVSLPGSDGYTSTIVPLLEAFGVYNIKTQYQYREDIFNEYDSILLDIINPLWDKVEDLLNAPIEMLADILPNLSLFFANDGLLQIVENLLTPVSALLDALKPIVDVNEVLNAAGLNVPKLLKDKVGISISKFDVYDLAGTLKPIVGADNVVGFINSLLKVIKIGGNPLGLELPDIDWFRLASHGEFILNETSQAATFGGRISVKADQDETLIAVLRYLIDTINYKDNYDKLVKLVTGLLPDDIPESIGGVIDQVFGMLQGDTDKVITDLVDLLQQLAG